MKNINTSIFKAYDIRGIYPTEIDEDTVYRIGRGLTTLIQNELKKENVSLCVSNDMRLSSPQLKGKVIQGMLDQGATVYDVGFSTTPTFYFVVGYTGTDGGLQLSASHNPAQYNGCKLVRTRSVPISEDSGINEIKNLVIKNVWHAPKEIGIYRTVTDIVDREIESLVDGNDLNQISKLKIVVDSANAMGILDLEPFFKLIPKVEVIFLNQDLNGKFPNHEADPLKDENLAQLQEAVIQYHADFGISPDGDGDRYFFVDEKGEIIRQEIIRGIMAQIAIKENPGSTVCYDIRPGRITKDMIEASGGKASVTRVGHSLIKEQMLKENAVFGGESSGHYFYKTKYGTFETPHILLTKLLAFISQKHISVSEIIKPLKKYHHSGEINSVVKDSTAKIKQITNKYRDAEISFLDGVTVTYSDYWFNVRASNTEPKIRLNLEAVSETLMHQKRDEVLDLIRT